MKYLVALVGCVAIHCGGNSESARPAATTAAAAADTPSPAATEPAEAVAPATTEPSAVAQQPPEGFVMPTRAKLIASEWPENSFTVWSGEFQVDPADPDIAAKLAKRPEHEDDVTYYDGGDIGVSLYSTDLRNAKVVGGWNGMFVEYKIQDGALEVQCRSTREWGHESSNRYRCIVARPGS